MLSLIKEIMSKTKKAPKIGEQIREARLQKKLSQAELSKIVGCDRTHLTKIETGRINPTLETLERIAEALGVELYLL